MPDNTYISIFKNKETGKEREVKVKAVNITEASLQLYLIEFENEECIEIKIFNLIPKKKW